MSTPLAPPRARRLAGVTVNNRPRNLGRLGDATKYLRIKMLANLSPAELRSVACVSRAFHPTDGSKGLVEAACAELVRRLRAKHAATPGVVPAWARREGESWPQWVDGLQVAALVRARRTGRRMSFGGMSLAVMTAGGGVKTGGNDCFGHLGHGNSENVW